MSLNGIARTIRKADNFLEQIARTADKLVPFERLTNFFKRIAGTVRMADNFFDQKLIARTATVRTDAKFFGTDSSSRSNGC